MKQRVPALASLAAVAALALGSCGGGGGGETEPPADVGVTSGFSGNLNWESAGGDGSGGVGDGGASGDGGVGAGGDFGQFIGANVCVFLDDGTRLGCALTDSEKGMVTIKPGRNYRGGLRIELTGTPTATYYEEGRDQYVPFPPDRKIRVWVPQIDRNIGITPFTEAAYRMLTEGSAPESVGTQPSKDQIRAANERVRKALNEHFPTALAVDDIARLPFIKSQSLPAGSMGTDPRGRYGLVNGAFSKQASFHHGDSPTPTLDMTRQLAEDLLDGRLDGRNGNAAAGPANGRTYDPHTLTGELSSALAEQATRFGAQEALDALPKVLNFGNVRYEGYLFDGSISRSGSANSTVAGWVAENTKNFSIGQQFDRLPGRRALALYGNSGHGGGFYKADVLGPRHKVFAIGDNVNGELGTGSRGSTNAQAVEIDLPGAPSHIAGGFAHTLARMADGSVWAWGDNSFGQLGQNDASLAGALRPVQVSLPVAAVAVAAASTTSFALGIDGKVYAWGANGGFGLLGNGSADGTAQAPVEVAGLADIVQISARDNDVVVLRRDGSVWHWGSHPADENAFVPGSPGSPYLGGTRTPVRIEGLPAGVPVRKVITEQGLFAVLLANGHVYTWGVHFDITAGQVLRTPTQMIATRILGLPPIRDMMPGGFQGYGARAFDRLTAMGVDYGGGLWKIRGRVGEVYDPDTEASRGAQRRPQGQGPRVDCENCHTFLDQTLAEIRAASQQPTSGLECVPPSSAHDGLTASLVHRETDCVQCHNPARLSYPVATPSGTVPFAATNGWPNCVKPTSLPNRNSPPPPATLSNSCEVPPDHVFTPPGTVCASCHNSVVARPLRELTTACAQPRSSELPTIPVTASVAGAFTRDGVRIGDGAATAAGSHQLRGAVSAALAGAQALEVQRNGAVIGNAVVSGSAWTFDVAGGAPQGTNAYRVRVVAGSGFGAFSNVVAFTLDSVPPAALAAITGFEDDALGAVAIGGFASDATPRVIGSLTVAPGAGEVVQVLRNGAAAGTAAVGGTGWVFIEPAALASGVYTYRAQVADAAGNTSAPSAAAALTIVAAPPTAAITQALDNANAPIASGSATSDNTPAFNGTLSAALPAGHVVRIYRDGAALAGSAAVSALAWTYTDPGAGDGSHVYAARVEAGAVQGAFSAEYTITVDTVAPAQVASVTQIADDFNGNLAPPVTTADTTPIINGTLTAPLAAGEQVQVRRNGAVVGTATVNGQAWSYTEPPPGVTPPAGSASVTVTYSARVVDAAGLLGPATGAAIAVTISPGSFPLLNAGATITTVNGIAPGAQVSYSLASQAIGGTLARPLAATERVAVYRNTGTPVVTPAPCGVTGGALAGSFTGTGATTFSVATSAVAAGTYFYLARIEQVGAPATCGASLNTVSSSVVAPPTATVTAIRDSAGSAYADGALTSDTTPLISGTVGRAPQAGEQLQVLRDNNVVATVAWAGTTWSYVQSPALPAGTYGYSVRPRDAAGATGAQSAARTIGIVTNLPTASITGINGIPGLANGAPTNDTSPTIHIQLGSALPAGYVVRVLRNGTPLGGGLTSCAGAGNTCSYTDSLVAVVNGTYSYTVRTETGGATATTPGTALGAESVARSIVLDTVDPAQPTLLGIANNKPYQNTTTADADQYFTAGTVVADATPVIEVTFSGTLGAGEVVRLYRQAGGTQAPTTDAVMGTWTSGSVVSVAETQAGLRRPDVDVGFAPAVLIGTRRYYAIRTDAAGNTRASATFTFTQNYLACSATRARARALPNNHAAYSTDAGFTVPIATCDSCHTVSGTTHVAAPADGAFSDRYWCVR